MIQTFHASSTHHLQQAIMSSIQAMKFLLSADAALYSCNAVLLILGMTPQVACRFPSANCCTAAAIPLTGTTVWSDGWVCHDHLHALSG